MRAERVREKKRERKKDREGRSQLAPGCSAGVLEGGNDSDLTVSIFLTDFANKCPSKKNVVVRGLVERNIVIDFTDDMTSRISPREMERDQPLRFPCYILLICI